MEKFRKFLPLILILFGLIVLLDFFQPGLPVTHDGQDHVARIANFYQSLSEGNLVPRWAANLNWGYGHPVIMFLYPLPSYTASLFHCLGFSLVDSTKIVFGLGFLLSGFFMYLWLKEIWGEEAGFAGGFLYLFAPYRFVDLYVRGAIGENFAFIWPPLICWLLLKISREKNWLYLIGASLSLVALILSHNALSLMFLPLILGYAVFLIYTSTKKKRLTLIINFFLVLVFGFWVAAFYWLPAFFEGRFTLRDIVTKGNITGFEPFSRLLWSSWNYLGTGSFSVQLGIIQWLAIIITPFLIWKLKQKKDNSWLFLSFLFFLFWLAIFMILPITRPIYFQINLLQKFQFVWRFLSLAILPPAVFLAAFTLFLPKKKKWLFLCFLILFSLFLNKDYWRAKDYSHREASFYTEAYPGTTDTGESAPIWSVRFMEEFPQAHLEVIEGEAVIEEVFRNTTRHEYQVRAAAPTRLVDNTLYFKTWEVFINNQPTEIQYQDPDYRGLITFNVPEGEHQVVVQFRESFFRLFTNCLSLLGLILLFTSGLIIKRISFKR